VEAIRRRCIVVLVFAYKCISQSKFNIKDTTTAITPTRLHLCTLLLRNGFNICKCHSTCAVHKTACVCVPFTTLSVLITNLHVLLTTLSVLVTNLRVLLTSLSVLLTNLRVLLTTLPVLLTNLHVLLITLCYNESVCATHHCVCAVLHHATLALCTPSTMSI
jgi:hypothetical protein